MKRSNKYRSIGVIDIGSNSIRLVAYDLQVTPPKRFFNEKIMCRLGKDIDQTGRLNKKGKLRTKLALNGFLILAKAMKLDHVFAIATSAMREAKDGVSFAKKLEKKYGIKIKIIDGEQEAAYSGYGVTSSLDNVAGVVADLGGGSLELVNVESDHVSNGISLPLGALRVPDPPKSGIEKSKAFINEKLNVNDINIYHSGSLYAVGGSWRKIALAHQIYTNYKPIDTHGYEVESDKIKDFCLMIAEKSHKDLISEFYIEKKRAHLISRAAMVLFCLLDKVQPNKVVFSNAGLRDGFVYKFLLEH